MLLSELTCLLISESKDDNKFCKSASHSVRIRIKIILILNNDKANITNIINEILNGLFIGTDN